MRGYASSVTLRGSLSFVLFLAASCSAPKLYTPKAHREPSSSADAPPRYRIECGTVESCRNEAEKVCGMHYRVVSETQSAEPGWSPLGPLTDPIGRSGDASEPGAASYTPGRPVPRGELVVECDQPKVSAPGSR